MTTTGYETGVSTGPSDLISKIYAFATGSQGWTGHRTNGLGGDGPGADNQHSFSDASAAAGFAIHMIADNAAATAHIQIQPSKTDSGSALTDFFDHPGSPDDTGATGTFVRYGQFDDFEAAAQGFDGTSIAYHLFAGTAEAGRYIHCVVEGTTGAFWHLHFGSLDRGGAYAGGQYVTAGNFRLGGGVFWPWQGININNVSAQWARDDDNFASDTAAYQTDGTSFWHQNFGWAGLQGSGTNFTFPLYMGGLNGFNQRTAFAPNWLNIHALRAATSGTTLKIIGSTPDVRLISMSGREPGEEITIGSDVWKCFPTHVKSTALTTTVAFQNTGVGGSAPNNNSGLQGFALKKHVA